MHMYTRKCGQNYHCHGSVLSVNPRPRPRTCPRPKKTTAKCWQNYHFHSSVHGDVNLGGVGKAWGGLGKAWVGTGSELGRNWVGTWVGTLAHDVRFTFPLVELVKQKEWTDHHHFTPHATTDVLRHALRCVRLVLQPQQDNISLCSLRTLRWLESRIT